MLARMQEVSRSPKPCIYGAILAFILNSEELDTSTIGGICHSRVVRADRGIAAVHLIL
jgi:hypothetical protein